MSPSFSIVIPVLDGERYLPELLDGIRAQGREAITAEWMAEKESFGRSAYDAHYEPIAVGGDIAVAHGRTRFFNAETGEVLTDYDNIWVLRFGPDGRCCEFHEWYAARPEEGQPF
jgi:hypothetical protein